MIAFIVKNLGTIITCVVVLGIVTAIVVKIAHDKRKGKSIGCGCGCASCPKASGCGTSE